ncbi:MAG TPA: RNA polymerase-binding protein DksA [Gammaproteobacteria bacterium]|nr:RNA polymerase-binding protein DksA [Gammaproteobacteria bacterium]
MPAKKSSAAKSKSKPIKPKAKRDATSRSGSKTTSTRRTEDNKSKTGKTAKTSSPSQTGSGRKTKTANPRAKPKTKKSVAKKARISAKVLQHNPLDSPFRNFSPYVPASNEAYMSARQLKHFNQILTEWRQDLMGEVDRTMILMQDEATNFPDPTDRAAQEEEFSIELKTRDRERKLIKKIDQTLERIEIEDYGYCDTCGVEVGLRRLEARPTANQCIDCKSRDELRERQLHG